MEHIEYMSRKCSVVLEKGLPYSKQLLGHDGNASASFPLFLTVIAGHGIKKDATGSSKCDLKRSALPIDVVMNKVHIVRKKRIAWSIKSLLE